MKIKKLISFVSFFAFVLVASPGCREKGPMEKAGEAVDGAVKDAGKAIKEGVDKVEDSVK